MQELLNVSFCGQIQIRINRWRDTLFQLSKNVRLYRVIESNLVIVNLKLFYQRAVHIAHPTPIAGHTVEIKMFYFVWQYLYCPFTSADTYSTVESCTFFTCDRTRLRKRVKYLRFFLGHGIISLRQYLYFGTTRRVNQDNTAKLVMTFRFSKSTKTVLLRTRKADDLAVAFRKIGFLIWYTIQTVPR